MLKSFRGNQRMPSLFMRLQRLVLFMPSKDAATFFPATKYAVLGFTQGMWVEGLSPGVKTHAVCPSFIRTNIVDASKMVNIERSKILGPYKFLEKMGISAEK